MLRRVSRVLSPTRVKLLILGGALAVGLGAVWPVPASSCTELRGGGYCIGFSWEHGCAGMGVECWCDSCCISCV